MVALSPGCAVVLLVVLSAVPACAQPTAFEFSFWPGKSPKRDPRILRFQQHPCGQVAIARVSVLPSAKGPGALHAEEVLEVNAAEETLRRWRVPVDSYPLAFRGDSLVFQNGVVTYRVDPHGRVSLYPGPKPAPTASWKNCSAGLDFPNSSYVVCQTLTDLITGQPRRVRFEAPCT